MKFIFDGYGIDYGTGEAEFHYRFDDGHKFLERVSFDMGGQKGMPVERAKLINRALFLSYVLAGTSYYKCFPTREVELEMHGIDGFEAEFFSTVYQEGLSQFAFENHLTRDDLAHFETDNPGRQMDLKYDGGQGVLSLQSGGKDSLLTATLLDEAGLQFTPWFLASGDHHPAVLNQMAEPLVVAKRTVDREALELATADGGLNGHVPITYIVQSLALVQALILGKNQVLVSIGHEGTEAHAHIGDLAVNHQWSKTWEAEQLFAEYVARYVSPDLKIGSPLRSFSELKVSELFVKHAWEKFGHSFSSCNVANYRQHADNSRLKWCGNCPKCANAYILFAPFVAAEELQGLFGDQDLFAKPSLEHAFKGLLGVDGVMKPFECVGEVDELRAGYHRVDFSAGYSKLSFDVPTVDYDYLQSYENQAWAHELVKKVVGG